ncbi:MAG: hypothetical protein NT132_07530 [Microbacterium sp.]|uniref:hypothetical protein n=1 Tax=Microbacterium sp. TaxID=51671 RepID=UPI002606269C|nr:hypothetical protein [Microbacterium sp.]MCX6502238.1 hypothetical protein [Microbacterium sp.]
MGELDDAARQLERLLRDPLATAVRGTLEITAVSAPAPRGRYQEARIEGLASAPGMPPAPVEIAVVLPVRLWPRAGMRLPAQVPPSDPQALEVAWGALAH